MALSTTSWISLPLTEKKTDVLHGMASVPGLFGEYVLANNHDTSGWRCGGCATRSSMPTTPVAEQGVHLRRPHGAGRHFAAGAGGVVFTPWLQGERSPITDAHVRGGFHNVSLRTGRADLVRAVLEGVAYNDRWLHHYVEKYAKARLDPIRFVGGGAGVGPLVPDPR